MSVCGTPRPMKVLRDKICPSPSSAKQIGYSQNTNTPPSFLTINDYDTTLGRDSSDESRGKSSETLLPDHNGCVASGQSSFVPCLSNALLDHYKPTLFGPGQSSVLNLGSSSSQSTKISTSQSNLANLNFLAVSADQNMRPQSSDQNFGFNMINPKFLSQYSSHSHAFGNFPLSHNAIHSDSEIPYNHDHLHNILLPLKAKQCSLNANNCPLTLLGSHANKTLEINTVTIEPQSNYVQETDTPDSDPEYFLASRREQLRLLNEKSQSCTSSSFSQPCTDDSSSMGKKLSLNIIDKRRKKDKTGVCQLIRKKSKCLKQILRTEQSEGESRLSNTIAEGHKQLLEMLGYNEKQREKREEELRSVVLKSVKQSEDLYAKFSELREDAKGALRESKAVREDFVRHTNHVDTMVGDMQAKLSETCADIQKIKQVHLQNWNQIQKSVQEQRDLSEQKTFNAANESQQSIQKLRSEILEFEKETECKLFQELSKCSDSFGNINARLSQLNTKMEDRVTLVQESCKREISLILHKIDNSLADKFAPVKNHSIHEFSPLSCTKKSSEAGAGSITSRVSDTLGNPPHFIESSISTTADNTVHSILKKNLYSGDSKNSLKSSSPVHLDERESSSSSDGSSGHLCKEAQSGHSRFTSSRRKSRDRHNSNHYHGSSRKNQPEVRIPEYDGSYEAGIFIKQLDKITALNHWNEDQVCANLMGALKGQARDVLACFTHKDNLDSHHIIKALEAKFGRKVQEDVARSRLQEVKQGRGQTLRQLGFEIEKLIGQAYGEVEGGIRDSLAVDAFLQALLDLDVRLHVRLSRPKNLEEALLTSESVESAVRQARSAGRKVTFVSEVDVEPVAPKTQNHIYKGKYLGVNDPSNSHVQESQTDSQEKVTPKGDFFLHGDRDSLGKWRHNSVVSRGSGDFSGNKSFQREASKVLTASGSEQGHQNSNRRGTFIRQRGGSYGTGLMNRLEGKVQMLGKEGRPQQH